MAKNSGLYRIFWCYPVFRQESASLKVERCMESEIRALHAASLHGNLGWISRVYNNEADGLTIPAVQGLRW